MKVRWATRIFKVERRSWATSKRSWLALLLSVSLLPTGCVRRHMLIRSYPEGAVVYVDQQEVGITPVQVPFTYYGAHRILLEKDGFETVEVDERIDPPWYQIPPIDFIVENLWWKEIRDDRIVDIQLQPQVEVREHELRERAETLRGNVRNGFVTPLIDNESTRPTAPSSRLPQTIIGGGQ